MNLSIFKNGTIQDCITLLALFELEGITDVREMKHYLNLKVIAAFPQPAVNPAIQNIICCDICGGPATISNVNVSRCTRVPGGYKSVKMCTDYQNCGYTEYFYQKKEHVKQYLKTNKV